LIWSKPRLLSKLSYIGLVLLLVGIVLLAVGEVNLRNVNIVEVGRENDVWSYAINLTRGNWYGVDISASDDWGKPFGNGDFTKPMPVNVTITSPGNDTTRLQAFFYGLPSSSPYYKVGTPPTIVAVSYQNVDDVGLTADSLSAQIRFMPKQNGPYNVTVLKEGLWSTELPDYILFSEEVVSNREMYSLLTTGGGALCAVGGIAFIASLFKSRNTKSERSG
jgi:hypothetical protein